MTLHKLSNQSAERIKESYKIVPIIYNLPLTYPKDRKYF